MCVCMGMSTYLSKRYGMPVPVPRFFQAVGLDERSPGLLAAAVRRCPGAGGTAVETTWKLPCSSFCDYDLFSYKSIVTYLYSYFILPKEELHRSLQAESWKMSVLDPQIRKDNQQTSSDLHVATFWSLL